MKRYLAGGIGGAAALMMIFGPGLAGALNEYNGMTFAKAQETASRYGETLVIATKTGSYLAIDDCIVVGDRQASTIFRDSSGRKPTGNKYLVDLNCNDLSATNGHPGNSAVTPEGKKVLEAKQMAVALNKGYAKALAEGETYASCFRDDGGGSKKWCISMCDTSKACSPELSAALGL